MADSTFTTSSPAKVKKVKSSSKTMYQMAIEALKENKKPKGLSLAGMKKYIIATYPESQENFSNQRLRKAIQKALESGEVVRHAKSEETSGAKGFFVINKSLMVEKEKALKKKMAEKAKAKKKAEAEKAKKDAKPKKVKPAKVGGAKPPKSPKAVKSPKSPKAAKLPKSPKAAKSPKAKKALAVGATKGKNAKETKAKVADTKVKAAKKPLTETTNKKKATPKKKTPVAKKGIATPKTSKAATAGLKKKTAAVKKTTKMVPKEKA